MKNLIFITLLSFLAITIYSQDKKLVYTAYAFAKDYKVNNKWNNLNWMNLPPTPVVITMGNTIKKIDIEMYDCELRVKKEIYMDDDIFIFWYMLECIDEQNKTCTAFLFRKHDETDIYLSIEYDTHRNVHALRDSDLHGAINNQIKQEGSIYDNPKNINFSYQDYRNMRSVQNNQGFIGKTFAGSQYSDYGKSQYDRGLNELDEAAGRSLDDIRASNQSGSQKPDLILFFFLCFVVVFLVVLFLAVRTKDNNIDNIKMQAKKKILVAFEDSVQGAISDNHIIKNDDVALSVLIQSAIAETSQFLKESIVGNFELSKLEIDSIIDEAVKETMNKYFKSW